MASMVLPIKSSRVIPAASAGSISGSSELFFFLFRLLELESRSSGSIRDSSAASSSNALAKSNRRCFSRCRFRSDFLDVGSGSSSPGEG